mgnify:CR=1 FL=1|tara:strand:- start:768 stop:1025 length:258 start_codon:yes stop_codon:yes gene_type:complete
MSGKVPKRILTERTGSSREGSRIVNGVKMNEGAAMLGLVGSVGHRNTAWTQLKKRSFTSELQVDCKEGKINKSTCDIITNSMKLF